MGQFHGVMALSCLKSLENMDQKTVETNIETMNLWKNLENSGKDELCLSVLILEATRELSVKMTETKGVAMRCCE